MNQTTKSRIGSLISQMNHDINFLDNLFEKASETQIKFVLSSIGAKSEELSQIIQQYLKFGDEL